MSIVAKRSPISATTEHLLSVPVVSNTGLLAVGVSDELLDAVLERHADATVRLLLLADVALTVLVDQHAHLRQGRPVIKFKFNIKFVGRRFMKRPGAPYKSHRKAEV